jgi:nicotinate phosphoribosyltransferase
MAGDLISLDRPAPPGGGADTTAAVEPLIQCVMREGYRVAPSPSLDEIRRRTKRELERLPDGLRRLDPSATYPVKIADDLIELADEVDDRMRRQ